MYVIFFLYSWYAGGGILFSNGISHSSIDGISLFGPTSLQIDFNEISFPRSTFMAVEYVCQTRYSGRDYRASVSILDPGTIVYIYILY